VRGRLRAAEALERDAQSLDVRALACVKAFPDVRDHRLRPAPAVAASAGDSQVLGNSATATGLREQVLDRQISKP
jgi:hypothetical protein